MGVAAAAVKGPAGALRRGVARARRCAIVATANFDPVPPLPGWPFPCGRRGAALDRRAAIMYALLNLIDSAISIYIWLLIGSVVLSWLVAFNVINTRNRFVYTLGDFLHRITEPALRPIRNVMPSLGGIDISPVILILLLYFVRDLLFELLAGY